ncbi:MAG: DUF4438 domain-containing protein [Candidatus Portnoybacteria bacterium RIFCSPLOWO2_02_FULL_39_11]|uniref:DUF4438 domain-containing protein n=1 Tax=Candidatus Portnoybacteria bacterium RIFCSPLOWO2_02_FULL_39_11 TaxID=1802001 RepID=A0A1G2FSY6_9BACT|nr:MAG: DUF4438 domain-containing protein [Candidatus Portnoybacteria bacterium RIFCSPLOWO2_02_FULL_39_11]
MLKLNLENLVKVAVMGEVASPVHRPGYQVSHEGQPFNLPSVGGITYNVKIGDLVAGWIGDHIEPGVSTYNKEGKDGRVSSENIGYNTLACIGNEAKLISGPAKGGKGVVTGMHGGVEHVLIDFPDNVMAKISYGDKVQITAFGMGLAVEDLADITIFNLDPDLLFKINPKIDKGKIKIPVVAKIPPYLMGSGLGYGSVVSGDYDITMADEATNKKLGLDKLRFGDLVAIADTDNSFGRTYRPGALTIGVVVHSDCVLAGHGPGVTTIMTSRSGKIEPVINKDANIGYYLKIGRWRNKK